MRLSYAKPTFYGEFTELMNSYSNYRLLNEKDVILAYTPGRLLYEINNVYARMCFENRTTASEELPMLSATNPEDAYTVISFITEMSTELANEYGKDIHEKFCSKMEGLQGNLRNNVASNFIYPAVVSMLCSQLLMPNLITEKAILGDKK